VTRPRQSSPRSAGLDPAVFSGHSLRAGFVKSALAASADVLRVMDVTRHKEVGTLKATTAPGAALNPSSGPTARSLGKIPEDKVQRVGRPMEKMASVTAASLGV
jgi:hypothetical protein